MRKTLIAGNWKMNTTRIEAATLSKDIVLKTTSLSNQVEIALIPPFTNLDIVEKEIKKSNIKLGAQNVHEKKEGAYTGEISITMLKDFSCNYVLVGHSERRQYFNETNETINKKIHTILNHNVIPILCVGETLEERNNDITETIIENQLNECLKDIDNQSNIVIAYEPIWAIGTGQVATPNQAQEIHQLIRDNLSKKSLFLSENTQILYGGSVKAENINDLITKKDIDGALVGGASLTAESFEKIIHNCVETIKS